MVTMTILEDSGSQWISLLRVERQHREIVGGINSSGGGGHRPSRAVNYAVSRAYIPKQS
jgi:hypothetical protein